MFNTSILYNSSITCTRILRFLSFIAFIFLYPSISGLSTNYFAGAFVIFFLFHMLELIISHCFYWFSEIQLEPTFWNTLNEVRILFGSVVIFGLSILPWSNAGYWTETGYQESFMSIFLVTFICCSLGLTIFMNIIDFFHAFFLNTDKQ